MGLFGGIIGAAILEATRNEWRKLPSAEISCVNALLARNQESIDRLAKNGVGPGDPRIAPIRNACSNLLSRHLRQNVECPIGSVTSYCDEAFARPDGSGGFQPLSLIEAVQYYGLQQLPETALVERLDAQARRKQMQSLNPNSDRVPAPNFNCSKAKSSTERAICGSYQLSLLDGEYGDLYRRTLPLDKHGEVKREARQISIRRESCNGALSCIEDNLNHGVNYLAKFLRRNGVSVITAAEQQLRELKEKADLAAPPSSAQKSRRAERTPSDEATTKESPTAMLAESAWKTQSSAIEFQERIVCAKDADGGIRDSNTCDRVRTLTQTCAINAERDTLRDHPIGKGFVSAWNFAFQNCMERSFGPAEVTAHSSKPKEHKYPGLGRIDVTGPCYLAIRPAHYSDLIGVSARTYDCDLDIRSDGVFFISAPFVYQIFIDPGEGYGDYIEHSGYYGNIKVEIGPLVREGDCFYNPERAVRLCAVSRRSDREWH
jgi:uncharacterized protein